MSRTAPSNEEVHDAYYVDYEAWEKGPPIILGVLRVLDGVESFRQEVLHEEFRAAAIAKGLTYSTAKDSIERLANEVATANVVVIAWSQHELEDLFLSGSPRAIEILSAAYRNAIPLATSWRRRCVPNWHPPTTRLPPTWPRPATKSQTLSVSSKPGNGCVRSTRCSSLETTTTEF